MARQASGTTPRRRSTKGRESGKLIQMNDDAAEKAENRRSSKNHNSARRHSMMTVARETLNNPQQASSAPLLANFEQWMKLVKDNKINATNSWNFALIDYFHDMSLLKEGDGINFQKASYTLDGCVKIYTSRVDSVATETGKLLSGLADSKNEEFEGDDEDDDEDEDGNVGEQQQQEAKAHKRKNRKKHAESTLAASFEQLQVKKLDLELSIDPLFRKMCADFDEGGAKGLLLNSLTTDKDGRVVFDGEVDYDSEDEDDENEDEEGEGKAKPSENTEEDHEEVLPLDMSALRADYFPDIDLVDSLEVCPSMVNISNTLNDPALLGSSSIVNMDTSATAATNTSNIDLYDADDGGGDIGDMGAFEGLDIDDGLTFGDPNGSHIDVSTTYVANYALNATAIGTHENDIMSYFDETLKKNWAGPEHWKVQKLKASSLLSAPEDSGAAAKKKTTSSKDKEPFIIDFLSPEGEIDESTIFTEAGSSTINLPKSQWKSKSRNLLPNDKHFSSKNLIKLFIKPKGTILSFGMFGDKLSGGGGASAGDGVVDADEHFWANQYQQQQHNGEQQDQFEGNYDANFFQDDNGGVGGDQGDDYDFDFGDDFNPSDDQPPPAEGDLKGQLLMASRRARPEYVNYARTAKRVDVKLLKDNLWTALDIKPTAPKSDEEEEEDEAHKNDTNDEQSPSDEKKADEPKSFSSVVQDLKSAYNTQQMSEISTSFCFICVLHLANEQGLIIDTNEDYSDLMIRKDPEAPETEMLA